MDTGPTDLADPLPGFVTTPAHQSSWEDLQTVLGTGGAGHRCQCQRYKLEPGESFAGTPLEVRAHRLRQQTDVGHPGTATTSGLVGYLGSDPVGWCAVEPRPGYEHLVRTHRVAWTGREEDRGDVAVWAITCLFTRAGFRRRGISRALAAAAVAHARAGGARACEAYPITTTGVIAEELHVGTPATFAAAGLREIGHPTPRRLVMRIDF